MVSIRRRADAAMRLQTEVGEAEVLVAQSCPPYPCQVGPRLEAGGRRLRAGKSGLVNDTVFRIVQGPSRLQGHVYCLQDPNIRPSVRVE